MGNLTFLSPINVLAGIFIAIVVSATIGLVSLLFDYSRRKLYETFASRFFSKVYNVTSDYQDEVSFDIDERRKLTVNRLFEDSSCSSNHYRNSDEEYILSFGFYFDNTLLSSALFRKRYSSHNGGLELCTSIEEEFDKVCRKDIEKWMFKLIMEQDNAKRKIKGEEKREKNAEVEEYKKYMKSLKR